MSQSMFKIATTAPFYRENKSRASGAQLTYDCPAEN